MKKTSLSDEVIHITSCTIGDVVGKVLVLKHLLEKKTKKITRTRAGVARIYMVIYKTKMAKKRKTNQLKTILSINEIIKISI